MLIAEKRTQDSTEPKPLGKKLSYRPDIDGLRAIAVIPVILFHLGFSWMSGGYLGVDVFFVISGFLITYILTYEMEVGKFSFKSFLSRRVKRILPALLTVTLITLFASIWIAFLPDLQPMSVDALSATFSFANIHMLNKAGDYWGQAAESSPFLHAWSLSVEEQFYFFYPALLLVLVKVKKGVARVIAVLFCLSLFSFYKGISHDPISTFYLLPARSWEMLAGGLAALFQRRMTLSVPRPLRSFLVALGLCLIVVAYFYNGADETISKIVFLSVLGSILIVFFGDVSSASTRALAHPALVLIGKFSYAAYLVHWPIIVLAGVYGVKYGLTPNVWLLSVLIVAATLALYFWVEKPARKMKQVYPLVVALLAGVVLTTTLIAPSFANQRYASDYEPVADYGASYDVSPLIKPASRNALLMKEGVIKPDRDPAYATAYAEDGILAGNLQSLPPEIMVIGDSHGCMWAKTIAEAVSEMNRSVSFFTALGNKPVFDIPLDPSPKANERFTSEEKFEFHQNVLQKIEDWRPSVVVVVSKWSNKSDKDFQRLEQLIEYCNERGVKTLLMEQPPLTVAGDRNTAQFLAYLGHTAKADGEQYIATSEIEDAAISNQKLQDVAQKYEQSSLFEVFDDFHAEEGALIAKGPQILYFDDDHLSYQGTSLLKGRFAKTLDALLSS
ncbi:MAG: acyltransferase family protein [Cyanobacteria bacterium J06649_5]